MLKSLIKVTFIGIFDLFSRYFLDVSRYDVSATKRLRNKKFMKDQQKQLWSFDYRGWYIKLDLKL